MKTSIIYSVLLLGLNASVASAQDAAPRVLRGSPQVVAFKDYVKDNAQQLNKDSHKVHKMEEIGKEEPEALVESQVFEAEGCSPFAGFCRTDSDCCRNTCGFIAQGSGRVRGCFGTP